jgi:hypothetical protein
MCGKQDNAILRSFQTGLDVLKIHSQKTCQPSTKMALFRGFAKSIGSRTGSE